MAAVQEGIRSENNRTISFGNYTVKDKQKVDGFELNGDIYKVKTHDALNRLEKNGQLLFESVPGSAVHGFDSGEKMVAFQIEGFEDTQVTLELEPQKEYKLLIDDVNVGSMKSNFSGKVSFSLGLGAIPQFVKVEKMS